MAGLFLLSGGGKTLIDWGSTPHAEGQTSCLAERTGFPGMYRNEERSEMCFLLLACSELTDGSPSKPKYCN
jgi:hypothetical protein